MKRKKNIIIIISLAVIIVVVLFVIMQNRLNKNDKKQNRNNTAIAQAKASSKTTNASERKNKNSDNSTTTLSATSEVKSALIEKQELRTNYYLEEVYVEEKQYIEKGGNILKYTNGTYLTAPYDCYIASLNLPEAGEKCSKSHYVQLQSKNILTVSMKVDEKNINKLKIGTEATVKINAIQKTYTGYITHISSSASNGKFTVTIEFENDGEVKLGMTSIIETSF